MLDIHRDSGPDTKIYFTHSLLPTYIDPQNVSTKKYPFAAFNKQPFTHTLDLILPDEIYDLVHHILPTTHYARVHLKLTDILAPDFLTTYIKHGNIAMLSQGRPLIDNRFHLIDGTLTMELDRPMYERCGLHGVPTEDGGKKHAKQRWIVTYDLRIPSMKHGKSGFGRLEWAAKNVLNESLTWLWWNAHPGSKEALSEGREVLSAHAPSVHGVEPSAARLDSVLVPKFTPSDVTRAYGQDESLDVLEYIHLLSFASPRLSAHDSVDADLSRYEVPDFGSGIATKDMVCVRWKGFMTPAFVRDVFLGVRQQVFKSKKSRTSSGTQDIDMNMDVDGAEEAQWFSLSAQGFGGKNAWTLMQFLDRQTLTWEIEN